MAPIATTTFNVLTPSETIMFTFQCGKPKQHPCPISPAGSFVAEQESDHQLFQSNPTAFPLLTL